MGLNSITIKLTLHADLTKKKKNILLLWSC